MKLPRFSLRELFLIIVIAAMGCGWWVDHAALHTELDVSRYRLSYWPKQPGEKLEVELDADGVQTITSTVADDRP